MDCEWGITPFEKPVFPVTLPPVGIINVPVCSKHTWDVINIARSGREIKRAAYLLAEIPEDMPIQSLCEFVSGYIKAVNDYCEDFADIYGIPDKPDFEHDEEETKLPVLTFGERIVREHTGFDFDRINELDILDYKLLLADACKIKILGRSDGSGKAYLNECWEFMHRKSSIFE